MKRNGGVVGRIPKSLTGNPTSVNWEATTLASVIEGLVSLYVCECAARRLMYGLTIYSIPIRLVYFAAIVELSVCAGWNYLRAATTKQDLKTVTELRKAIICTNIELNKLFLLYNNYTIVLFD